MAFFHCLQSIRCNRAVLFVLPDLTMMLQWYSLISVRGKMSFLNIRVPNTYRQARSILEEGQNPFLGTGCQVAGLKSFLDRDFDNLLCIDLICHGVPSPLVWKNYINYLDKLYEASGIESVTFREKKPSWKVYISM